VPLEYSTSGRLRLKSTRVALAPKEDKSTAQSRLQIVPQARDTLGSRAFLDTTSGQIMATGAVPGKVSIFKPPSGELITDFALGYDGIFYIAAGGNLRLQDKRQRWSDVVLNFEEFRFGRLASDPYGGVWALNVQQSQLGRVEGKPLPEGPQREAAPGVMRPAEENPNPPRLSQIITLPEGEHFVALCSSPGGRAALLSWQTEGAARVRLLSGTVALGAPQSLLAGEAGATANPVRFPYSAAFLDEKHLAVLVTSLSEALVYELEDEADLLPTGDVYPLLGHTGEPFLHGMDTPPHYPTKSGSSAVCPISYRSFVSDATITTPRIIDSGKRQTEWHRLYLEAVIPPHCGVVVSLSASDTPIDKDANLEWFDHLFGLRFSNPPSDTIPTGAWEDRPSELPFHPGVLGDCSRIPNQSGLFTVLVQRAGKKVRSLRGRYLAVRAQLIGDGLTTPEIASLRVYASRFSFVKNYLPELFHESVFPPESESGTIKVPEKSTPADFLERFVNNFEGILTEMEDRVAASYLMTMAGSTTEEALPWLASWIGLGFDPAFPAERRRELLKAAPALFEHRGTLSGLRQALDVATGGMVSNGSAVVVEEYRLRRTFATILGANLADTDDPLLPGFSGSGNSYVGETLFLGDEHRKEFLALFGPQVLQGLSPQEAALAKEAIFEFYERLAHRVTVLVHDEVLPQDFGLINRVTQLEKPAHVIASVQRATYPFLVGIASLLGLDTYLRKKPDLRPVRVDVSRIGGNDVIFQVPSLDPRFEVGSQNISTTKSSAAAPRAQNLRVAAVTPAVPPSVSLPIAKIDAPHAVRQQDAIRLDASASEAPLGRKIVKYRWTLIRQQP
jgi:phage tail-like protein